MGWGESPKGLVAVVANRAEQVVANLALPSLGMFLMFAIFNFASVVFVIIWLPETVSRPGSVRRRPSYRRELSLISLLTRFAEGTHARVHGRIVRL